MKIIFSALGLSALSLLALQPNSLAKTQYCALIGVEGAGEDQQIRVYQNPELTESDGSYGLPADSVEYLDYRNMNGHEAFLVKFPESKYSGWVIAYHIYCPHLEDGGDSQ
jgi:hypothetical protein